MKANVPAAICFVLLVYFCWALYRSKHRSVLHDPQTSVEITVYGPDGSVIPAVGPAESTPEN